VSAAAEAVRGVLVQFTLRGELADVPLPQRCCERAGALGLSSQVPPSPLVLHGELAVLRARLGSVASPLGRASAWPCSCAARRRCSWSPLPTALPWAPRRQGGPAVSLPYRRELVCGELLGAPVPVDPELLRVQGGEQVHLVRLLDPGDARRETAFSGGCQIPSQGLSRRGQWQAAFVREKKNCHPRPSTQGTLDKVP